MDRNSARTNEKAPCAMSEASVNELPDCRPLEEFAWPGADINFLAGIIKQGYPAAPYLSDRRREVLVAATERKQCKALSMASAI